MRHGRASTRRSGRATRPTLYLCVRVFLVRVVASFDVPAYFGRELGLALRQHGGGGGGKQLGATEHGVAPRASRGLVRAVFALDAPVAVAAGAAVACGGRGGGGGRGRRLARACAARRAASGAEGGERTVVAVRAACRVGDGRVALAAPALANCFAHGGALRGVGLRRHVIPPSLRWGRGKGSTARCGGKGSGRGHGSNMLRMGRPPPPLPLPQLAWRVATGAVTHFGSCACPPGSRPGDRARPPRSGRTGALHTGQSWAHMGATEVSAAHRSERSA